MNDLNLKPLNIVAKDMVFYGWSFILLFAVFSFVRNGLFLFQSCLFLVCVIVMTTLFLLEDIKKYKILLRRN